MRPISPEPPADEIEAVLTDEERRLLDDAGVPEEVKTEILVRLERHRDEAVAEEIEDGPVPAP